MSRLTAVDELRHRMANDPGVNNPEAEKTAQKAAAAAAKANVPVQQKTNNPEPGTN